MANHIGFPSGRSRRILHELAEALGCPVDSFFAGTQPGDLAMTEELLSLWMSIADREARQRILDSARAAAAKAGNGADPQA